MMIRTSLMRFAAAFFVVVFVVLVDVVRSEVRFGSVFSLWILVSIIRQKESHSWRHWLNCQNLILTMIFLLISLHLYTCLCVLLFLAVISNNELIFCLVCWIKLLQECTRKCIAQNCDSKITFFWSFLWFLRNFFSFFSLLTWMFVSALSIRYGKYCGIGHSGCPGEEPCDDLDACCMVHDSCVELNGNQSRTEIPLLFPALLRCVYTQWLITVLRCTAGIGM